MATEREYQAALVYLEQDIGGFVGASFVNMQTHEILAAHSVRPEFPLDWFSASCSRLVARHYRDSEGFALGFEEILVTLREYFQVCRVISPDVLLFVAAYRNETNLALIRASVCSRTTALCSIGAVFQERVA